MKRLSGKENPICYKNIFLSPSGGTMSELLRIFFLSHFGIIVKAHPLRIRAYQSGDFIMHNGDAPLEKIKGKNFCLGIYKSDWNLADILFWSKAGATSFFDLHDPLESWKTLFKDMLGGEPPFEKDSLKKFMGVDVGV